MRDTFYFTGNPHSLYTRMDEWRALVSSGHELGNHTLFHTCHGDSADLVKPELDLNGHTVEQLLDELGTAKSLVKAIYGLEERTFAHTSTNYNINGISFIDSIQGLFPAARGVGPVPKSMEGINPYYVKSWGVVDPTVNLQPNLVKLV